MVKRKCIICGREMQFKNPLDARNLCSEACSRENRRRQLASTDEGPSMLPLKAEDITDEGYINLIKAIVSRASHDVTHFKPGTQVRIQAERFFESDYFNALTGLDGEAILRDLRDKSNKKGPDVRGRKPRKIGVPRPVKCIETGVVYGSIKEAAAVYGCNPSNIWEVCSTGRGRACGMRWRYAEEG